MERAASEPLFATRSTEVNRTAEVNRSKQVDWSISNLERESGIRFVWFVVLMLDAYWWCVVVDKYKDKNNVKGPVIIYLGGGGGGGTIFEERVTIF